jgi:1-acyl-sn-glycerol-3-phosphate acyltransferase
VSRVDLIASNTNPLAASLLQALRLTSSDAGYAIDLRLPEDSVEAYETSVYIPNTPDGDGMTPDLSEAQHVFQQRAGVQGRRFILLSSALIYGTGPSRQSMVHEDYVAGYRDRQPSISDQWRSLEAMAHESIDQAALIILRPVTVLPSSSMLGRRLMRRFTVTLPGRDPVLQIMSPADLARAVLCAVEQGGPGIFNAAPDGAIPLHAAIRMAGNHRIPVPSALQRSVRRRDALDYLRYPWTVCNRKIKEHMGFRPQHSSLAALLEQRKSSGKRLVRERVFDDFGMDEDFIRSCTSTLFRFLCDFYWRIEAEGMEHVPRDGRAVLVGTHRGFVPWDAMMALHLVVRETGRIPRFLTHPGLFKFPFIASLMTRLGGVIACQESAERVLEGGGLVAIYPEGVRGAFALHRNAYKIQPSWRNTFVKVALRHRAPIVPFVNVGSADSLPVFAQIRSRTWTRYSDWPCIPLSTFPFLPVPLPSKWHVRFLPPIYLERQHPREAADDAAPVKEIGREVRCQMQQALEALVCQRQSVFF